jgi:pimeloyl-ACP methyl ester carboxylesterase
MSSAGFVYLHGFASSPSSQKARVFRERFAARGVRLEVPDLNEGPGGFCGLTVTRMLAATRAAAGRACGAAAAGAAGPLVLIGSSLGGYVAALYAAREPVAALVLFAPAFDFAGRFASHFALEDMAAAEARGSIEVFHYGLGAPAKIGWDLVADGRSYEPFPDVSAPTLVFHGRRDESVPVALTERFAAGKKNVRVVILEDDHQLLASTERIWTEMEGFLSPWLGCPRAP